MSETKTEVQSWAKWMHVAGVAYAVSLWMFFAMFSFGIPGWWAYLTALAFTTATVAFIGGWGRYMSTKR